MIGRCVRVFALLLAGCWTGSTSPLPETPARGPLIQQSAADIPGCPTVVKLRSPTAAQIETTLRTNRLTRTVLAERIVPDFDTPSDVVRTLTIDGRPVRGIVEVRNGPCVRSFVGFAVDGNGDIWKLEPPSGVVDYEGQRCDTGSTWVSCDLTGRRTYLYVLPSAKQFVGVVNPETGLKIEIPPGR